MHCNCKLKPIASRRSLTFNCPRVYMVQGWQHCLVQPGQNPFTEKPVSIPPLLSKRILFETASRVSSTGTCLFVVQVLVIGKSKTVPARWIWKPETLGRGEGKEDELFEMYKNRWNWILTRSGGSYFYSPVSIKNYQFNQFITTEITVIGILQ